MKARDDYYQRHITCQLYFATVLRRKRGWVFCTFFSYDTSIQVNLIAINKYKYGIFARSEIQQRIESL